MIALGTLLAVTAAIECGSSKIALQGLPAVSLETAVVVPGDALRWAPLRRNQGQFAVLGPGRTLLSIPPGGEIGPLVQKSRWIGVALKGTVGLAVAEEPEINLERLSTFHVDPMVLHHLRCTGTADCQLYATNFASGLEPSTEARPGSAVIVSASRWIDVRGCEGLEQALFQRRNVPEREFGEISFDHLGMGVVRMRDGAEMRGAAGRDARRLGLVIEGDALLALPGHRIELPQHSFFSIKQGVEYWIVCSRGPCVLFADTPHYPEPERASVP